MISYKVHNVHRAETEAPAVDTWIKIGLRRAVGWLGGVVVMASDL